jgi:hypothetical protein
VRRVLALIVVSAAFLAAAPHALAAGTTVSVNGTTATITVNVDVLIGAFNETQVSDETRAYFATKAREAQDYWNQAFAQRRYRGCTEFKLDLNLRVLPGSAAHDVWRTDDYLGKATVDGRHVVSWMQSDFGGATGRPTVFDPYLPDSAATDDYPSPFQHDLDGYWSPDMESARDFAHEVGHLMGLGDDYTDAGGSVEGRSGTLMDGGDAIDQDLVDRIGKIIEKAGIQLPRCWTGTMESDTSRLYLEGVYGGHTHCTDRWHATLEFGIRPDDTIEGNGEARLTSGPTCNTGTVKPATLETFVVRGHATERELTLQLVFVKGNGTLAAGWVANVARHGLEPGGPPLPVPLTDPCTAEGTVTVHDTVHSGGKEDPLTATDRFVLKCPQPGST